METSSVSLMIMYEDESVDVRYGNGARLQMSPCGCEFMLEKPADPSGHPLQPTERVRQRTRFTISSYKEVMVAALTFRNKHASRPYLPEELIPVDHKKPFVSFDTDVKWPEWTSCDAELGPGGQTIIRSEGGRAVLMLSPSGEEFSVEFTCSLSRTQNQRRSMEACPGGQQHDENKDGRRSKRNEPVRSRSCSPGIISAAQPKPEEMYQSTTVDQHHSCCAVPPIWCYPLSLARHLWAARASKLEDVKEDGTSDRIQPSGMRSHLPEALPLTCPTPHWHRWKVRDPLAKKEHPDQDLPTELVRVMWCQGVTYRILSGAVSVVEVSPGDGSVMRSNGVLTSYFTHHKPDLQSGQVKEVTYHLNNLPPDLPGQLYSVCSVVRRASRILASYSEARQSLKLPVTPSCLQEVKEGRHFSKLAQVENLPDVPPTEQHVNVTQTTESRSDLVAAELEKIKRFNFLLENNHLLRNDSSCEKLEGSRAEEVIPEAVNENYITEALQKTSKAIQDIDVLICAAAET